MKLTKFLNTFFIMFCLSVLSSCIIKNTNVITKTENQVDYISDDIKFSFYDTKGYSFYINLTKSMFDSSDKYGINLSVKSDEKYLSKKNKIKIMVDTEIFEIIPNDNGKIISYNIDPYYIIDQLNYEIPYDLIRKIANSKKCEFFIEINNKPILGFLNKHSIFQVKKFLRVSN